jgi:hypothetical protein
MGNEEWQSGSGVRITIFISDRLRLRPAHVWRSKPRRKEILLPELITQAVTFVFAMYLMRSVPILAFFCISAVISSIFAPLAAFDRISLRVSSSTVKVRV